MAHLVEHFALIMPTAFPAQTGVPQKKMDLVYIDDLEKSC